MKKDTIKNTIVLDTSVIAFDPHCFDAFPKSNIVLHVGVLTELDKIKKFGNEAGKNARFFIRSLDKITENKEGTKFELDNGSTLIIDVSKGDASYLGDNAYEDNHLINCARIISQTNSQFGSSGKVILVSRDVNLRMRAKAYNITAQDYDDASKNGESEDSYTGMLYINSPDLGAKLYESGALVVNDHKGLHGVYPNECIVFEDDEQNVIALGREKKGKIIQVHENNMWGIKPLNKEQAFASELLMDPDIPLVSLLGAAGTGKTLIALAAAMEMVINKNKYESLIVYRPMVSVGNELGFIPGSIDEKLMPWMAPITDCIEFIVNSKGKKKKSKQNNEQQGWQNILGQYSEKIRLEAMCYARGLSLHNVIILIDEAQNLSPSDMKTLLSRSGQNSKIFLTGDPGQVDVKGLDSTSNGLSRVSEIFKANSIAASLILTKGERSMLATEAARLM